MRKIIKIVGVTILLFGLGLGYQLFHFDNRYNVDNTSYQSYTALNKYEATYPPANYVDERMDASAILRSGMIGSMSKYDEIISGDGGLGSRIRLLLDVFSDRATFIKFTQENQYVEPQAITLQYVGEQYDHNFEYQGTLADGTIVTGNLAIWGDSNEVSTAISFQDSDGNIDENKARLFTDDSNAEMMAYLLIEAIQDYFGTNYEPNEAAIKFFNCSIENVAGSISYHAATSLASLQYEMGEQTVDKVKTANISTVDEDGFLVNQSY